MKTILFLILIILSIDLVGQAAGKSLDTLLFNKREGIFSKTNFEKLAGAIQKQ